MFDQPKKYYEIGAITKVCSLIEMLSTRKSWELSDLCRAMGMPKTTVHRMLLTLEDNGYVVQERQRGEYALSFKLFSIGSRVLGHSNLVDIARPFCRELLEAVDETVNLCVVSGSEMLVIDKQVTSQMLRQDSVVGGSWPIFQSASGKVFLAFAEKPEANRVLERIQADRPKKSTKRLLEELMEELESVRETGLAYDYEEVFKGVRCVAAPIFDYQNTLVATLSISAPTVRLSDEACDNIERNLAETAAKISQRLGAAPRASQGVLRAV